MEKTLQTLLAAAIRAPSGDNTQPWQFTCNAAAGRVEVFLDETSDPSPMNAGQSMARIACGAAIENMLAAARASGWEAAVETKTAGPLAEISVNRNGKGSVAGQPLELHAVAARATNRRRYDGRGISADTLTSLKTAGPVLEGVRAHWICGRERIASLSDLVGRADAAMFAAPAMRKAFLANIRFDQAADVESNYGMPLGSLEISALDRIAMRLMGKIPDRVFKLSGGLKTFAAHAGKLVKSASGLCVVSAAEKAPQSDVAVGRTVERAWLKLTEKGLAAQPMMSLLVLANVLENGSREQLAGLDRSKAEALLEEFRALVPELDGDRPAFLMRFGYAPPPTARTGRLPREKSASGWSRPYSR